MRLKKQPFNAKIKELKWIFETPIKDWIKYFKNQFGTSRYVIKGKCKKCGKCCETILFSDENGYIKTEEDFLELRKRNRRYYHFEINGRHGENWTKEDIKNRKIIQGALYFKCKSLGKDKKCKNYFFRSLYCRDYPSINPDFISAGGETIDGCGFYFDIDKKFNEYLNMD